MNKRIQFFSVALLASLLTLSSCGPTSIPNGPTNPNDNPTSENVKILGVDITSENNVRTVTVESTLQLTAVVYPADANQNVVWSSSNDAVATVVDGLVTGVAEGTVNIRATSVADSTFFKDFALVVEAKPVEVINPEAVTVTSRDGSTTVKANQSISLSAVVTPEGASQSVEWSSSDTSIATVNRGVVAGKSEGVVTITASAKDHPEIYDSIEITVEKAETPSNDASFEDMEFSTHATYVSCDDETKLKVKGTITHVSPVNTEGKVNFYLQNGTDGYYFYSHDIASYPVENHMYLVVTKNIIEV